MPPFMTFLLVRAGLNKACPPLVEFCASVLLLQRQNWIRDLEKEVIQRFLEEGISKQTYSAFLTPQLLLVRDPAVRQACSLSSREVSPYTMCLCTTGQQMNPSSVPQVYKGLDVPSPEVFHTQGSFQFPVLPQKRLFTDWGTDCDLQWGLFRAGLKITALGRVHLGSAWGTWSLDCSLSGNSQYSLWHFEIMFTLVTEFLLHPSPFKRYFTLFLALSI